MASRFPTTACSSTANGKDDFVLLAIRRGPHQPFALEIYEFSDEKLKTLNSETRKFCASKYKEKYTHLVQEEATHASLRSARFLPAFCMHRGTADSVVMQYTMRTATATKNSNAAPPNGRICGNNNPHRLSAVLASGPNASVSPKRAFIIFNIDRTILTLLFCDLLSRHTAIKLRLPKTRLQWSFLPTSFVHSRDSMLLQVLLCPKRS